MTEKEILRGPKTFCLNNEDAPVVCLGCDGEMKYGSFYLTSVKKPSSLSDYSLVEGYVCPVCAAKRISRVGLKTLLVSLAFAVVMLLSAWVITDFLKIYIQPIYPIVMIVLIAAAVFFLLFGIVIAVKRSIKAGHLRTCDDYDELLIHEFADDDHNRHFYHREPKIN